MNREGSLRDEPHGLDDDIQDRDGGDGEERRIRSREERRGEERRDTHTHTHSVPRVRWVL